MHRYYQAISTTHIIIHHKNDTFSGTLEGQLNINRKCCLEKPLKSKPTTLKSL